MNRQIVGYIESKLDELMDMLIYGLMDNGQMDRGIMEKRIEGQMDR